MLGLNGLALFGQGISIALIALGLGYIVCDMADKQKDFLKYLGYVVGPVIIILSLVMMANSFISSMSFSKRIGGLGMGSMMPQQKMMQPHMPMMQPQNQTQSK